MRVYNNTNNDKFCAKINNANFDEILNTGNVNTDCEKFLDFLKKKQTKRAFQRLQKSYQTRGKILHGLLRL